MEGSSSAPRPSESARAPGNASKYLSDLPSRGLFSTPVVPSNHLGDMRVYTCDHNTTPPGGQLIKTNPKNILIRALTLKQKSEPSLKNSKAEAGIDGTRKRTADKALNGRASSKRPMTNANAKTTSRKQEGADAQGLDKDFHRLTVEKLRAILKEGGLSPTGKKDELIARLKGANI